MRRAGFAVLLALLLGVVIYGAEREAQAIPSRTDLMVVPMHIDLVDVANGDLITDYPLDFEGEIYGLRTITSSGAFVAAKTSTLRVQINATDVPGARLVLTTANSDTLGEVNEALASRRGSHTFGVRDKVSVLASDTTAFADGAVTLQLLLRRRQ